MSHKSLLIRLEDRAVECARSHNEHDADLLREAIAEINRLRFALPVGRDIDFIGE
jgi:hypothetical protein